MSQQPDLLIRVEGDRNCFLAGEGGEVSPAEFEIDGLGHEAVSPQGFADR